MIDNARGNYHFLKGIRPYSSAVVAAPGYEIVHVTLGEPLAYEPGFYLMARYLAGLGRPVHALCAVELRSPRPFSFESFAEFNTGYRRTLADAEILVEDPLQGMDDLNPVARTNVAPEIVPPAEPSLYGFSYTVPCPGSEVRPTFVVAGAGELLEGRLDREAIVRPNEVSIHDIFPLLIVGLEYEMDVRSVRTEFHL